jgi:geranylgeranyl diphosphate synthase, type II
MEIAARIEQSLIEAVVQGTALGCPPRLAAAMRHAVFPKGARVRPRLCLSVAVACGDDDPALATAAAAAIELLHCASLVHDDLPCFDDADTRRGRSSVHRAYGEPLAVLAGDALIVLAFQHVAGVASSSARRAQLIALVGRAVGASSGIIGGQAWECESEIDVARYHRAKTGALFAAASSAGAAAAGEDPGEWRSLGETLGEAYQIADDIRDAIATEADIGKPVGRDAALGRPNSVASLGLDGAVQRLGRLVAEAADSVPDCAGAADLRALIQLEARRLVQRKATLAAA